MTAALRCNRGCPVESIIRTSHHWPITFKIANNQRNQNNNNTKRARSKPQHTLQSANAPRRSRPPQRTQKIYGPRPRPMITADTHSSAANRCAQDYAQSLYNPFTLSPETPICYPGMLAPPSFKFRTRTTGTFTAGTTIGGIAVWPYRMMFNDMYTSGGNDYMAIAATTAAYAATDLSFANAPLLPTAGADTKRYGGVNSPFSVADLGLGSNRAVRLVSCGIKVEYEGKEVDRAGKFVVYRHTYPSTGLPALLDGISDLANFPKTAMVKITDSNAVVATYQPLLETDHFYTLEPGVTLASSIGSRFGAGVFISGATAGTTFNFEVIAYFELIGRYPNLSPTHSAPAIVGPLSALAAAAPMPAVPSAGSVLSGAGGFISGLSRAAGPELKKAAARHLKKMALEQGLSAVRQLIQA